MVSFYLEMGAALADTIIGISASEKDMVSFTPNPEKFASAVAYLACRKQGVTKKELCKLLYFADRDHLLEYGRPITGDQYYALEQGPIPTQGLDALNGRGRPEWVDAVRKYGQLQGWTFKLEREPNLKVLSESDMEVLNRTLNSYGHLAAWQLEELSHQEPAWIKAEQNGPMDFLLFFENHPEAELTRELFMEENGIVCAPLTQHAR